MTPTPGAAQRPRAAGKDRKPKHVEQLRDRHVHLVDAEELAAFELHAAAIPKLTLLARGIKRGVDLLGALLCLAILSPVVLLAAIAVKLDSPGPVLFSHRRLGRDGRHFDCFKFRSMQVDAEHLLYRDELLRHEYVSNHFKIPTEQDPRVTRLGRFMRRSSLDELPQLWNVVKGDMSLVGPRPIVPLEATHYGDQLPVLLSVRPGLTGAWAVHGRSRVGYPERVDVELGYVRGWSLATDAAILLRTPWTVLTQRGAV